MKKSQNLNLISYLKTFEIIILRMLILEKVTVDLNDTADLVGLK